MTRRTIDPLRLRDTYWPRYPIDNVIRGPHPHAYFESGGGRADITDIDPNGGLPDGAMISTGRDLNHFFIALLSGTVVPLDQLAQMQHSVADPDSPAQVGSGVFGRVTASGVQTWGHGGSISFRQSRVRTSTTSCNRSWTRPCARRRPTRAVTVIPRPAAPRRGVRVRRRSRPGVRARRVADSIAAESYSSRESRRAAFSFRCRRRCRSRPAAAAREPAHPAVLKRPDAEGCIGKPCRAGDLSG
ncbi:serine hydrolase [Nocardia crassostreae]|uniref:serine hydrolase n=1 Tax=Nocardia crassostreae TaxID=53428 RepID=UPI000ABD4001